MQFQDLTITACPDCGCNEVVCERVQVDYDRSRVLKHVHGGRWETREFLCGFAADYVPSLRQAVQSTACRHTPEYLAKMAKEAELRDQIAKLESQLRGLNSGVKRSARVLA